MKDLAFCIEFVEYNAFVISTPGLSILEFYCSFFPTPVALIPPMPLSLVKTVIYPTTFSNKKNLDFWTCVVGVIAKYINQEIEAMLTSCLGLHFLRALVELFSWAINVNTPVNTKCTATAIETSRGPPSIFIPLPKIECSSCARSDLTIRSLIF